jgi:hypothetical protein
MLQAAFVRELESHCLQERGSLLCDSVDVDGTDGSQMLLNIEF